MPVRRIDNVEGYRFYVPFRQDPNQLPLFQSIHRHEVGKWGNAEEARQITIEAIERYKADKAG